MSQVIGQRLPATLALAGYSFTAAVAVAVPLGLTLGAATRGGRRRGTELAFTSVSILLATIPGFLLSVGLVYVFGVTLHWVPVAGQSGFSSYVLPVTSLAAGPAVVLARILRVEVLSALRADYVRTARAKRLPGWRVYLVHVLPNALTATLTICGLLLGAMIAGTVLVENVFAWPGLGSDHRGVDHRQGLPRRAGHRARLRRRGAADQPHRRRHARAARPALDDQGELMVRTRRGLRRALRTPLGIAAAALLALVLLLAVLAPALWSSRAAAIDTFAILQGPSGRHWLGTNNLGQDVFYRVLAATRLSVGLALRRPRSASPAASCSAPRRWSPAAARAGWSPRSSTSRSRSRRCCSRCSSR